MEYTEIRDIIQNEYDKKTTDTNFNFISRFAKAIYEAQKKVFISSNLPVIKSVCEHEWKFCKDIDSTYGNECTKCGELR